MFRALHTGARRLVRRLLALRARSTRSAASAASRTAFNPFSVSAAGVPDLGAPVYPADLFGAAGPVQTDLDQRCPGTNERPIAPVDPGDDSVPFTDGGALPTVIPRPTVLRRAMRRIALILTVVAAIAAALATSATGDDKRTYLIEMYNAFGLVEGSDVRVAGVNAGSVTDLTSTRASAPWSRSSSAASSPSSARTPPARVEPQSLIAEYFIDCQPDGPRSSPARIPRTRTSRPSGSTRRSRPTSSRTPCASRSGAGCSC